MGGIGDMREGRVATQPGTASETAHQAGRLWLAKLFVAGAVIVAAAGFAAFTAPQASAAYAGNVWVIYSNSVNCPAGGSVVGIYAAAGATWTTGGGGDWGDNIVYPRVLIGAWNTISAQVYCQLPWYKGGRVYLGTPTQHTFYAGYGGQNFWF